MTVDVEEARGHDAAYLAPQLTVVAVRLITLVFVEVHRASLGLCGTFVAL